MLLIPTAARKDGREGTAVAGPRFVYHPYDVGKGVGDLREVQRRRRRRQKVCGGGGVERGSVEQEILAVIKKNFAFGVRG